jgi:hypothetical protein
VITRDYLLLCMRAMCECECECGSCRYVRVNDRLHVMVACVDVCACVCDLLCSVVCQVCVITL